VGENPTSISVNPETNKIYVANHGSGSVSVIDGEKDIELKKIEVSKSPRSLAINPDEKEILVAHDNSDKLTVINSTTEQKIETEDVTIGSPCPSDLYFYDNVNNMKDRVYVSHNCSKSVFVISNYTNTNPKIQPLEIEMLGDYYGSKNNSSITINSYKDSNTFYVSDSNSNVISYVNLENEK